MESDQAGSSYKRMDTRTVVMLLVVLIFWGSAFAAIRVGLEAYAPGELALFRFLVASAVLVVYAMCVRLPLPQLRDVPAIWLLGSLGIAVYNVALAYGQLRVSAGAASLLVGVGPVFTAILAMTFLREQLKSWGWLGIALSFVGLALVARGEGGGVRFEPGAFLVVLAALAFSLYSVFQKPYLKRYGALQFTAYAIWGGTLSMLVFLPSLAHTVRVAPLKATLAVVYLGVLPGALGLMIWNYALSRAPASMVASFLYLVPVFAISISWVWLGEIPLVLSLVGGLLSLAGVVLVNTRGR